MKIATNLGLAVQMLAFSEAVLLAEKSGISRELAVEVLVNSVDEVFGGGMGSDDDVYDDPTDPMNG